ncbi:unnamed protein product [Phytophthora fragariaefolia]|uniref:Unnamed protein product n=1 Tax=Phytophthora fragariaefolia TaxID=1490495 RepID=A0A9W6YCQ6_9STRA|nr:unnamed protein product [Phytophthora fragariaefolia]
MLKTKSARTRNQAQPSQLCPLQDDDYEWSSPDTVRGVQQRYRRSLPVSSEEREGLQYVNGKVWILRQAKDLLTRVLVVAHCDIQAHRGIQVMLNHLQGSLVGMMMTGIMTVHDRIDLVQTFRYTIRSKSTRQKHFDTQSDRGLSGTNILAQEPTPIIAADTARSQRTGDVITGCARGMQVIGKSGEENVLIREKFSLKTQVTSAFGEGTILAHPLPTLTLTRIYTEAPGKLDQRRTSSLLYNSTQPS